ncbi:hypothetical protein CFRA_08525 [Corynebacterium frankenforstense DSM 45800]|uniref:DUF1707 domain-containing protein n=1 Tax=Corynebacterium frankenforstense DSM 45800 TaxID=1437875 RepID=A0A1L7CTU5_9CORY|nr:DUF1707 domain-containing protein [Corynebacterium frankenforstense]APT89285.1 hypothetical protein CFRA_08525 [Corynebacterium frankenforstense DSM 45800]
MEFDPQRPSDRERERMQQALTRAVGAGRLDIAEFDRVVTRIWETDDAAELGAIWARYIAPPPPPRRPVPPAALYPPAPGGGFPGPGVPSRAAYIDACLGIPTRAAAPALDPARPAARFPTPAPPPRSVRRAGAWTVPVHSRWQVRASHLLLDMSEAYFEAPSAVVELDVVGSRVEIVVPRGARAVLRARELGGASSTMDVAAPEPGRPLVTVVGTLATSSLQLVSAGRGGHG